jgi:hypothetical protein
MSQIQQEQNYWPGYLDALINVMLNLLFLVAIFAIGLVLLNMEGMTQQNQVSRLEEQAQEVVNELGLEQSRRDDLLQKIKNLDVAAILTNQRELARLQQVALSSGYPVKSTAPTPVAVDPPAPAPEEALSSAPPTAIAPAGIAAEAATAARLQASIAERQRQLAEVEQRLLDAQERLEQERARLAALQKNRAPTPSDQLVDFRVASATERNAERATAPGNSREVLTRVVGSRPQGVWEFSPGESLWPSGRALPEGMANASPSLKWRLVGFVDLSNARVRREVFARVQSVREQLISQGYARDRIELELRPLPEQVSGDEQLHRLIFILPVP